MSRGISTDQWSCVGQKEAMATSLRNAFHTQGSGFRPYRPGTFGPGERYLTAGVRCHRAVTVSESVPLRRMTPGRAGVNVEPVTTSSPFTSTCSMPSASA